MPGRDGTGPTGRGAMTGGGNGFCTVDKSVKYGGLGFGRGLGGGFRRGFGRNFASVPATSKTQKELLTEQKELLESRLEIISRQLESI